MGQALTDLRQSAWLPIAIKVAAGFIGLLILGGVGVFAALRGVDASAAAAPMALTAQLGKPWLAPVPPRDAGTVTVAEAAVPASTAGITTDGRVILNLADEHELRRLPGVGARRAEAIVRLRKRLGHFRRIQDLLRVRGIGPRSLRRMRPHLVLDPPKEDGGSPG
jgi:competence protein ComEA